MATKSAIPAVLALEPVHQTPSKEVKITPYDVFFHES
jgi:hypothetical protein